MYQLQLQQKVYHEEIANLKFKICYTNLNFITIPFRIHIKGMTSNNIVTAANDVDVYR